MCLTRPLNTSLIDSMLDAWRIYPIKKNNMPRIWDGGVENIISRDWIKSPVKKLIPWTIVVFTAANNPQIDDRIIFKTIDKNLEIVIKVKNKKVAPNIYHSEKNIPANEDIKIISINNILQVAMLNCAWV